MHVLINATSFISIETGAVKFDWCSTRLYTKVSTYETRCNCSGFEVFFFFLFNSLYSQFVQFEHVEEFCNCWNLKWPSVFDSDSTFIFFGKFRTFYLPSCKLYDADLIKRLLNNLSARWVRSKVSIWHQSATPEDTHPREYTIARFEIIDSHPTKPGKKENPGTESLYIRIRRSFLRQFYKSSLERHTLPVTQNCN